MTSAVEQVDDLVRPDGRQASAAEDDDLLAVANQLGHQRDDQLAVAGYPSRGRDQPLRGLGTVRGQVTVYAVRAEHAFQQGYRPFGTTRTRGYSTYTSNRDHMPCSRLLRTPILTSNVPTSRGP